jgi:hypothetical protein
MGMPEDVRSSFADCLFGAPCSEADLVRAETALGEDLPSVLRELYRSFDGFRDPDDTQLLWPLFAPQPGQEALVETNQFFRQGNLLSQDLAAQCLFFGARTCGPEYAWGIKRDLPGKVIEVHPYSEAAFSVDGNNPLDVWLAHRHEMRVMRREAEERARRHRYVRQRFSDQDMLMAREANEAGFYASCPYYGEPFDQTRYRVVQGGWDHQHCCVCSTTVLPGDEWWSAAPPDEIGLCLDCHARLFGGET